MKRTRFLAAMLGIGLVFGGCEQAMGGGKTASEVYTSADGISTKLVLTEDLSAGVPAFLASVNGSGAAYSALKVGGAFNYTLYRNGALISSGRVTIDSASRWTFTANSGGFTFTGLYYSGGTLAFSGRINEAVSGYEITSVSGVPAPVPSGDSGSGSDSGSDSDSGSGSGGGGGDSSSGGSGGGNGNIGGGGGYQPPAPTPTYGISLIVDGLDADGIYNFVTNEGPGYTKPAPLEVTILNTGDLTIGGLEVKLSGLNPDCFEISQPSPTSIAVGEDATFTVGPVEGRSLGEYKATVTVSGSNGSIEEELFGVRFKVNPQETPPIYSIGLSEENDYTFPQAFEEYAPQSARRRITVTNTGNKPTGALTVALSGADASSFRLSKTSIDSIEVKGSIDDESGEEASGKANFNIWPKPGLLKGTYAAKVTVSGDANITEKSFWVNFTVVTYGISLDVTGTLTFYTGSAPADASTPATMTASTPELAPKQVTITNTGSLETGPLTVSVMFEVFEVAAASSSTYTFTIQIDSIAAGANSTFYVRPTATTINNIITNNPNRLLNDWFTVLGDHNISKTIPVSISTGDTKEHDISIYTDESLFFYNVGSTKTITVYNTGTQPTGPLETSMPNDQKPYFTFSSVSEVETKSNRMIIIESIPTGGSADITVTFSAPVPADKITAYPIWLTVRGTEEPLDILSNRLDLYLMPYMSYLTLTNGSIIMLSPDATGASEDLYALCNNLAPSASITVNRQSIRKDQIKGAVFGAVFGPGPEFVNVTALPARFCQKLANLSELDLSGFTGLTSIGDLFMDSCASFNKPLTLPNGITSIGNQFLWGCTAFNSTLTLPPTLTSISNRFMKKCSAFNQPLVIPESVTSIDYEFMSECTSFNKTLDIPSSVTSITNNFLNGCSSFNKTLTLQAVTSIGDNFLNGCAVFNKPLTLPATVTSIGNNFMYNCSSFNQTLDIPSSVTSITNNFLNGCSSFNKTLTIPAVTSIGDNFLNGCTAFNKPLELQAVTSIGTGFLNGCVMFNQTLDIPSSVTSIANNFLNGCAVFNKPLTLPATVTSIGTYFLNGCVMFNQTLTIPAVTSIGNNFLNGCAVFNKPLDLQAVTSIGIGFMNGCVMFNQTLTIPAVTSIGNNFLNGCAAFNKPLDLQAVTSIGNDFMKDCAAFNRPLDLQAVTSIGNNFMQNCSEFNKPLAIPATVTGIGSNFLYNCDSLISTITVNCPATAFSEDDTTSFSTTTATAASYTTGIPIAGADAEAVKAQFPNSTSEEEPPYRKLIAAPQ